jgi:sugar phosphate isomerase/epimerase
MTIRIGANPIGWSNDDLQEIGGDTPLEARLAEAKQAGVEGVEKGCKLPGAGPSLREEGRRAFARGAQRKRAGVI